jgi:hypothetical protein
MAQMIEYGISATTRDEANANWPYILQVGRSASRFKRSHKGDEELTLMTLLCSKSFWTGHIWAPPAQE